MRVIRLFVLSAVTALLAIAQPPGNRYVGYAYNVYSCGSSTPVTGGVAWCGTSGAANSYSPDVWTGTVVRTLYTGVNWGFPSCYFGNYVVRMGATDTPNGWDALVSGVTIYDQYPSFSWYSNHWNMESYDGSYSTWEETYGVGPWFQNCDM